MGVLERDPEATAATLTRWLQRWRASADPSVSDVSIPGSTGWSNETILFDATWDGDDRRGVADADPDGPRTRRLVARIAPSGHQVFPDETFLRQHAVMHALAERTDVPMARVHWLESDPSWFGQPFWIMDRVAGDIPTDTPPYAGQGWLHDASPEHQAQAWNAGVDAMAGIHRVDLAGLGLPAGTYPDRRDTLAGHLDDLERFLAWAEEGEPHPLSRRALDVLRRDRPAEPAAGPCLVWGDARLSNLIYRDFEVAAVLDWEMSGIGDPLLDLGWWLFADWALTTGSGCTRLPGFPDRDETAARWAAVHRAVDRRPGVLRAVRRPPLHGDHAADGPSPRRHGARPAQFARDNLISRALADLLTRP